MNYEKNYPTWLVNHILGMTEGDSPSITLCSASGNEMLEVWYYGDLIQSEGKKHPYIASTEKAPAMVAAYDPQSGEKFLIFDFAKHGYDSMFCDFYEPELLEDRPLKRYDIPASRLIFEPGYGIDYDSEKEDYDVDENNMVELIDGRRISWENLKRDGMDWICLYFIDGDGQKVPFLDAELA